MSYGQHEAYQRAVVKGLGFRLTKGPLWVDIGALFVVWYAPACYITPTPHGQGSARLYTWAASKQFAQSFWGGRTRAIRLEALDRTENQGSNYQIFISSTLLLGTLTPRNWRRYP